MPRPEVRQAGKAEAVDARLSRLRQDIRRVVRAHQLALGRFPADPYEIESPLAREGWGQKAGFAIWLTVVFSTVLGGAIYALLYLFR